MDARKELILRAIVEEFIRSAEPVGSKALVEMYELGVSPATVRNDMAVLEAEGYIHQPHTSAGRIPTEKGYTYYISRFAKPTVKKTSQEKLREVATQSDSNEEIVRSLAKELVSLTGNMAVAAIGPRGSYYTGLSNLCDQPDCQDLEVIRSLTVLLDRFDDVMAEVANRLQDGPQVMLGSESPFGKDMAAVLVKYGLPSGHIGVVGLVGPMRMDYGRNIGLIEEVIDILDT